MCWPLCNTAVHLSRIAVNSRDHSSTASGVGQLKIGAIPYDYHCYLHLRDFFIGPDISLQNTIKNFMLQKEIKAHALSHKPAKEVHYFRGEASAAAQTLPAFVAGLDLNRAPGSSAFCSLHRRARLAGPPTSPAALVGYLGSRDVCSFPYCPDLVVGAMSVNVRRARSSMLGVL
jgi:hypothetical protein